MAGENETPGERVVRVGEQTFNVPADMSNDDIMAAVGNVDAGFANGRIREDESTHELVVERVAGVKG
jgi:hypothetical protein